jgi:hypothetical protein
MKVRSAGSVLSQSITRASAFGRASSDTTLVSSSQPLKD